MTVKLGPVSEIVIEAFDQPWKRKLEGTVGGYWGLYDDDLRDKFPLSGPVVEDARWWIGLIVGCACAVGFTLLGAAFGKRRSRLMSCAGAVRALAGFFIGATAAAEVRHFIFANRDGFEWVLTMVMTVVAVVTATFITEQVARWIAASTNADVDADIDANVDADIDANVDHEALVCASMIAAFKQPNARGTRAASVAGALQGFWLIAATIVNLLLVFDARYRDFPSLLFTPVIVAYALLALTRCESSLYAYTWKSLEIEEKILSMGLMVAAIVIVVMELPINASADWWALLCLTFAASTATSTAIPTVLAQAPAHRP